MHKTKKERKTIVCVYMQTYRECVRAIVLPHLQQGHHHLMEFISRQSAVAVHIEHFEANCELREM